MKTIFRALVFGFAIGLFTGLALAEYQVWREDQAFRDNPHVRRRLAAHAGRQLLKQVFGDDEEPFDDLDDDEDDLP